VLAGCCYPNRRCTSVFVRVLMGSVDGGKECRYTPGEARKFLGLAYAATVHKVTPIVVCFLMGLSLTQMFCWSTPGARKRVARCCGVHPSSPLHHVVEAVVVHCHVTCPEAADTCGGQERVDAVTAQERGTCSELATL
jgi:hypothetical protein